MNPQDSTRFRLRKELAIIPMAAGVQLRAGDNEIVVLESSDVSLLTRLLTQCQTEINIDKLTEIAGNGALANELISELHSEKLVEPTTASDNDISRYLRRLGSDDSIPEQCITVASPTENTLAKLLCQCIAEHGLSSNFCTDTPMLAEKPKIPIPPAPIICCWEQPHLSWANAWNLRARQNNQPCLFVDLSHGNHATIGPFYFPDESACYECLQMRLRENTAAPSELDAARQWMLESGTPLPHIGTLPAFRYQVTGIAIAEIFAAISKHRPLETLNRAITLSFEDQSMWSEPVWRIPGCKQCCE